MIGLGPNKQQLLSQQKLYKMGGRLLFFSPEGTGPVEIAIVKLRCAAEFAIPCNNWQSLS